MSSSLCAPVVPARCSRCEVVQLDHGGAEAPRGGVEGAARSRGSAADDEDIKVVLLERRQLLEDQKDWRTILAGVSEKVTILDRGFTKPREPSIARPCVCVKKGYAQKYALKWSIWPIYRSLGQ